MHAAGGAAGRAAAGAASGAESPARQRCAGMNDFYFTCTSPHDAFRFLPCGSLSSLAASGD